MLTKKQEYRRKYYLAHKKEEKAETKSWNVRNRDRWMASRREHRRKLREAVLDKYERRCVRCGFDKDSRILQIDHVFGDGRIERKRYSKGSTPAYLRKVIADVNGEYQLLCPNCNWTKYWDEEKARYVDEKRWDKVDNPAYQQDIALG